jgi:hypothetical protein
VTSEVGSVAVAVASGVVEGVGSGPASGDVEADAEFEMLEGSEVSDESTDWAESVLEAHPAAINIATHTNEWLALLPMTKANVHGDLNFFYLCVV